MRSFIRSCPVRVALAATLAAAPIGAAAQGPCDESAAPDSGHAVLVIHARVHADALVFESDPDTRITLNGCEPARDLHVTSNLPDPIEPGVRYTDVEITAEYRVRVELDCRAPGDAGAALCDALRRDLTGAAPPTDSTRTPSHDRSD